jgi:hypothetical protein
MIYKVTGAILVALFVNWQYVSPNSEIVKKAGISGHGMKKEIRQQARLHNSKKPLVLPAECFGERVICNYLEE